MNCFAVCVVAVSLVKMDYFARSYDALRAAPQSGSDTIEKLCERLLNGASIEERKAALLGLKGLSRDWKAVGPALRSAVFLADSRLVCRRWGLARCLCYSAYCRRTHRRTLRLPRPSSKRSHCSARSRKWTEE